LGNPGCKVNIQGNNQFIRNRAVDGGAIKWTKDRPQIEKSTIYKENNASYGKDVGSYPGKVELEFIKNNDDVNPYDKSSAGIRLRRRLDDSVGYVPPLVSGNKMDFNVYILDQDGYLYTSDSSSKAVLDKDSPSSDIILLNNEAIAK
jgi:hypothetical protein